jgi:LacI family transcriptional regulator
MNTFSRSRKPITINQVALEAQVSTQTVSRVINNRPDVAPETRQRVQDVIARLGYLPNALARSLIHQRSHTLGVVATGLEYYGPSRTLVGIEKQARALDYSLLLDLLHHPEIDHVDKILNRLLSQQVDGIIWAVPQIGNNRAWLQEMRNNFPVPLIFLSMQPQTNTACVAINNFDGARMAIDHLLAQGYRHIGLITGPLDWWESNQRLLGWQQALNSAGLIVDQCQIVEGNWSADSGESGFQQLMANYPQLDAVFAANDQMALGVMQGAYLMGKSIPHDLAVVGFDDVPEAAYYWPSLTTVHQPLIELGSTAVQELNRIIETWQVADHDITTGTILLQPELVIRRSSVV